MRKPQSTKWKMISFLLLVGIIVFSVLTIYNLYRFSTELGDAVGQCGGYGYDVLQVWGQPNMNLVLCHTGSMCGVNWTGHVLVEVDSIDDIKVGDPIMYKWNCTERELYLSQCYGREAVGITHRVIAINYQERTFLTQGDCNPWSDGWSKEKDLLYKITPLSELIQ